MFYIVQQKKNLIQFASGCYNGIKCFMFLLVNENGWV